MQMPKMNTNPRKIRKPKRTRGIFSPAITIGAGMDELPAFYMFQWATPIYKTWQNSTMAGCLIVYWWVGGGRVSMRFHMTKSHGRRLLRQRI